MKLKRKSFSTTLVDLYGRDNYQSHIEEGREYWWCFPHTSEIYEKTHQDWHKLKVTYVRSKCFFYVFTDTDAMDEQFCAVDSIMGASLVFAELDPSNDLEFVSELSMHLYRFNDEKTVIKNWDNDEYVEVDDDDIIAQILLGE